MKKRLVGASLIAISCLVNAESGSVSGNVTSIRASHETAGTTYFQMEASVAGSCRTIDGKVMFVIPDNERGKQQFSMVLSARMAGQPITVNFDDVNYRQGEWCVVRLLDI